MTPTTCRASAEHQHQCLFRTFWVGSINEQNLPVMLQHQRTVKESLLGSWVQENTSSPLDVQDQAEALLRVVTAEPLLQLLSVRRQQTDTRTRASSQNQAVRGGRQQ